MYILQNTTRSEQAGGLFAYNWLLPLKPLTLL